jgi:hypothetical protein
MLSPSDCCTTSSLSVSLPVCLSVVLHQAVRRSLAICRSRNGIKLCQSGGCVRRACVRGKEKCWIATAADSHHVAKYHPSIIALSKHYHTMDGMEGAGFRWKESRMILYIFYASFVQSIEYTLQHTLTFTACCNADLFCIVFRADLPYEGSE